MSVNDRTRSALELRGLSKAFRGHLGIGRTEAVVDLDLEVRCGQIFGLLGPNGAGKTTTIKLLTTLLPIDGGRASVAGFDVGTDADMVRRSIGLAGQSAAIDERLPWLSDAPREQQPQLAEAFAYMGLRPGEPVAGTPIDVAFIGSCTNGRISDLREAARVARSGRVAAGVKALVVPGSQAVARQAQAEGLDDVFRAAGFEWREAGCSMCLAMNPDKLVGRQVCASSSNRNFKGRQGSPTGRTLLMSPAMVAAAALRGKVTDVREML